MTNFWLDSPDTLLLLNFTDTNGILNFTTLLTILITSGLIYKKVPNALNYGMLIIIVIIVIAKCFVKENFTDISIGHEYKPSTIEQTKPCKPATIDNPYGNPNITDFGVKQKYKEICNNPETKQLQNDVMHNGIFMNSNDYVWRRNQQDRWYSVPNGTVPNDQMAFANWCYNDNNNCKAGNIFRKNPDLASNYLKSCTPDLELPQNIAYSSAQPDYVYTMLNPK